MARKTSNQLNVRISDEDRAMLDEIEACAHIRDSALTHAFVSALREYWQKHKSIKLPLRLAEDSESHEFHANAHGATAKIQKPAK
jgi:hypothetical protein